jgi:hypothetical protein
VSARPGGPAIRPQPRCRREGRSLSRSVFRAASGREGSDEIGIRVAGHGPQPEQGRVRHLGHLPAREGAEAQHGERGALSAPRTPTGSMRSCGALSELCSAGTPSRSSRFGGESKNLTRPAERTGVRARSEHCFGGPAGSAEA